MDPITEDNDDGDPLNASVKHVELEQQDYQDTIDALSGPKAKIVEPFRLEYEKLYKALLRSHESEKRLTKKIRDLNAEITGTAQGVQTALKTAAEDQQNIANLRKELEGQQKLVAQSLEKERRAKESIAKYQESVAELQQRIDEDVGMSADQELQLAQLHGQKEQLEKDRDMLKQSTDMLLKIYTHRCDEVEKIEQAKADSEEKILDIKQKVAQKHQEVDAEKRRKEELEQRMKELRSDNEQRVEELATVQRNIAAEEVEYKKVEQNLIQAKKEEETLDKRVRSKMDEQAKFEEKLVQETDKNKKFVLENQQRELALRSRKEEISRHEEEKEKLRKVHEALKKKDKALTEDRSKLEGVRNDLKFELKSLQEQIDRVKKEGDVDRKKIEDLLRERDILNKSVVKADERTKQQIDLVKRQETQALNMQKDIGRWKQDAQEFRKRMFELEKQRDKYALELQHANAKYASAKEELKQRGVTLTDLKKQIQNVDAKLNQQKNLYDSVCMDRNLHAKNLEESKEQIDDMHRRFKIMHHQTTALKEEIREKDNRVVRGHFKREDVLTMNERLKDAKDKAQRRVKNLEIIVETHRTQMKKLESTIQEAEQERQAQQKEIEGVIGEREILRAQLIRRDEEVALLYEKIKIQQSTLQKGESQYAERVAQVGSLRSDIRKAKAEVSAAKTQVTNVDSLKREIHYLSKVLLREQAKAAALQEELNNPMNVHRWRELESWDPTTYEMIQKVKSLQKLLIAKTEEVVEKDSMIQDKEKLYVQLKNIIARQPGPEVAEQLSWHSQHLKDKTAHMKQMSEELENYHQQVHDLRDEIDRHNKDFSDTKQAYFQKLRRERNQFLQNGAATA